MPVRVSVLPNLVVAKRNAVAMASGLFAAASFNCTLRDMALSVIFRPLPKS